MSSKASTTAVSIRGLTKAYQIAHKQRHATLAEALLARARRPFARQTKETFWALRDIDLDIGQGNVVGIVGRNGAGKSTLLKILSRITEPTAGRIELFGRVGSLLEVGTGFHSDLSGRENIFLNGSILGMTKAEIRRQFDAIVDFAGVEQFLDTPVKRYSSGMYVRLAFAVAAHLSCEILIVDEVLAVGDAEFQQKCMGKMREVAGQSGKTVLFVSHNIGSIQQMCNQVLYLRNGQQAFYGSAEEGIRAYSESMSRNSADSPLGKGVLYEQVDRANSQAFAIRKVQLLDLNFQPIAEIGTGESFVIRLHIVAPHAEPGCAAELSFTGPDGTVMSMLTTKPYRQFDLNLAAGEQALDCIIQRLPLTAGKFILGARLTIPDFEALFAGDNLAYLDVQPRDVFDTGHLPAYSSYAVLMQHEWRIVPATGPAVTD